ncbi:transcription-repair coupling factor (superfamily II helicase) [Palleronia aestuarii]|uniref:Transcription-repair-coupling factor n=1 Tax=Palleronia aestuarii TaxID=568105 RepID=A0A2W7N8E0_9RHOB|nr:DEAD/DEAH box helicase [Palleronia aestuarii]PZX15953.1 transcription-repair coupling factor (superfamily II helicase) [Palleronia aestuarii]
MADISPAGGEAIRLLRAVRDHETNRAIYVARNAERAAEIFRFLSVIAPDLGAVLLPRWDCLPYDWASPGTGIMGRRLAALRRIEEDGPVLVLTSPAGLLQRVLPADALDHRSLACGTTFDVDAFQAWALRNGYAQEERVGEPGDLAIRGSVIDIFPAAADAPVRFHLEDGKITEMKSFDPVTQLTVETVDDVPVDPATELPPPEDAEAGWPRGEEHWLPAHREGLVPLTAYLPDAPVFLAEAVISLGDRFVGSLATARRERSDAEIEAGTSRRPLEPDALYLGQEEWEAVRDGATPVSTEGLEAAPEIAAERRPRAALGEAMKETRCVLLAGSNRDAKRMARMAKRFAEVAEVSDWKAAMDVPAGQAALLRAPLHRGFRDGELLALTSRDLLGHAAEEAGQATVVPPWLADAQDLHHGDLVVHEDEGLGRFEGLEPIEAGEALRLVYADDKSCLVPLREAGLVWRYGHDTGDVSLDNLGSESWNKRRARFARSVQKTAAALAERAEARARETAPKLSPETREMKPVADSFPHAETADQSAAIRAVLDDLGSGRPMDRLLVGDVGFGKTEVAIRAAAAAALSGHQVAIIAPTTVLARQHATTFSRRLGMAGLKIASLSRLSSKSEADKVRTCLADGTVDVVVGTHAILKKGTEFARLGLVVIDEEQRFGKAHKKALRDLASGVHVLSMTATPIPRSLQGAIAGLQELSLLTIAPARRRPVHTIVTERADGLIRDALSREHRRGGQSFVVVPRIEDIEATVASLKDLVPNLDIRIAHGKLPAREIDETMTGFAEGRGDVLLATSLIESGLDVPRANTMVVLRPDLLGLAQLHQLRGRVGRSERQAHCWLLVDPDEEVTEETRSRLETFEAEDGLGAGFALSVADLDRRGAGDLFGDAQSGHEARIGPALHAEMLASALRQARGEDDPRPPDLTLPDVARLPAEYVPREDVRASLYVRIARARTSDEADRLADEIEDRFGPLPKEAAILLEHAAIRIRASALGVSAISAGPKAVALDYAESRRPESVPKGFEVSGDRVVVPVEGDDEDALSRMSSALEGLDPD